MSHGSTRVAAFVSFFVVLGFAAAPAARAAETTEDPLLPPPR